MSISTFFGLELGKRALFAFRRAIDTVSHNVSNVNTPGYHRQTPIFEASDPFTIPSFTRDIGAYQVGSGVDVTAVNRLFDRALENSLQTLLTTQGNYNIATQFLQQIDAISTSTGGINDKLTAFFNAFHEVADNPESITTREIAIQAGVSLSAEINQFAQTLVNTRSDADKYVQQDISNINTLLGQIRDVNVLIRQSSAAGDAPNDLLDQRDEKLNELAKYVDIQVVESTNNGVQVYIGGRVVVQDDMAAQLIGVQNPANYNYVDVKFADNPAGPNALITDGELRGLLDMRDSASSGILYYKQQLDTFATQLINTINAQHTAGFDMTGAAGGNFFNPVVPAEPALNIQVRAALLTPIGGPQLLAASSTAAGVPGNGLNALTLAGIANTNIAGLGGYTFNDFYTQLISHLGANTSDYEARKAFTDNLVTETQNLRDTTSAVSLDEEGTYLMQYEKSYQAAAKIITTYQSMLDELMNLVG
jgi:flagellar hook-associated protein 1